MSVNNNDFHVIYMSSVGSRHHENKHTNIFTCRHMWLFPCAAVIFPRKQRMKFVRAKNYSVHHILQSKQKPLQYCYNFGQSIFRFLICLTFSLRSSANIGVCHPAFDPFQFSLLSTYEPVYTYVCMCLQSRFLPCLTTYTPASFTPAYLSSVHLSNFHKLSLHTSPFGHGLAFWIVFTKQF